MALNKDVEDILRGEAWKALPNDTAEKLFGDYFQNAARAIMEGEDGYTWENHDWKNHFTSPHMFAEYLKRTVQGVTDAEIAAGFAFYGFNPDGTPTAETKEKRVSKFPDYIADVLKKLEKERGIKIKVLKWDAAKDHAKKTKGEFITPAGAAVFGTKVDTGTATDQVVICLLDNQKGATQWMPKELTGNADGKGQAWPSNEAGTKYAAWDGALRTARNDGTWDSFEPAANAYIHGQAIFPCSDVLSQSWYTTQAHTNGHADNWDKLTAEQKKEKHATLAEKWLRAVLESTLLIKKDVKITPAGDALKVLRELTMGNLEREKAQQRQVVKTTDEELKKAETVMIQTMRRSQDARAKLQILESGKAELMEKMNLDQAKRIQDLVDSGIYETIYITKDAITAITTPIRCDAYADGRANIGKYRIEVRDDRCQAFRLDHPKGVHQHPHISADGHICWGNVVGDASKMLGARQYIDVLELAYSLVRNFKQDGAHIAWEPWLKQIGVKNELPAKK